MSAGYRKCWETETSLYLTFFFNFPTMLVDFAHILSTFWFNYLALLTEILLLR